MVYEVAQDLASQSGGHYMDQFTFAERATDWRGNNNIAQSMFSQLSKERHSVPSWVVVGAGTGGTSATIGRYTRYQQLQSQLCVVDPEGSAFSHYYHHQDPNIQTPGSKIEGIGRPRLEASFVANVVDRMIQVKDAESVAAMQLLSDLLGRKVGPSTGTNFVGMLQLAQEMIKNQEQGSILSILCDSGERYLPSYYNEAWLTQQFGDVSPTRQQLLAIMG